MSKALGRGYDSGPGDMSQPRTRRAAPLNSYVEDVPTGRRKQAASDHKRRRRSSLHDNEKLLDELLEAPQTREVQQQVKDLMEAITKQDRNGQGRKRTRAKSGAFDEEDNAEVGEEGEDSPPAWSRGHHPGSTKRKRATKPSNFQEDGDEVEDFDDEVLKDEAKEAVSRDTRLRLRVQKRKHSPSVPLTKQRIITRLQQQAQNASETADDTSDMPEREEADNANEGEPPENDEGNDSEASEEEEEEEQPAGGGRYPARNRATTNHYDPSRAMQQPKRQRRGGSVEQDEGSSEEDDGAPGHRYPLRDRGRQATQATPPKEQEQNRLRAGPAAKARRLGFGGGPRRGGRRARPTYHLNDDDVLDQNPDGNWAALDAGARGGTAGAVEGSSRRAQPWEVALGDAGALSSRDTDRQKNVEITPVQVDTSVTFDQVGGLEHYVKALKEMVFLPLVYPELFERFHINPPRGVLFYGPPGTGKTLVARALAAHASRAGQKVSFFMRKGADVLSKWVGEAERQLRLLFEEAQKAQPAIIFFDEIDGLAPVRSSKQDQIHNSIVSTLLALMDGLDSRGQVVVIGATNRIDALDGALRRPGRFDRELVFPLPNLPARASIIDIHTRKWAQPPPAELQQELANKCVGYCGADLKALCTEASLRALRRRYPQIYKAEQKLLLDPRQVSVERRDFLAAFSAIVPASHRSAAAHARPLPCLAAPVLKRHLEQILGNLARSFPPAAACLQATAAGGGIASGSMLSESAVLEDSDDEAEGASGLSVALMAGNPVMRPRVLICGPEGAGQAHLAPALLYALEGLPVHAIGLPALLSDASARSPEEAMVHAIIEARRAAPAILYLPHLTLWWDTAPSSLRATLWMLLADLPADLPLMLFATADAPLPQLPHEAMTLFGRAGAASAYELGAPSAEERAAMFEGLANQAAGPAKQKAQKSAPLPPPELPVAPDATAAAAAAAEKREAAAARQAWEEDESALRSLRMALREITTRLLCNRQWKDFWEPVDPQEDPEFYEQVSSPMDLGTILCRVDNRQYPTAAHFMADVALIAAAARQYWQDDPRGIPEVSRARALEDQAWEAFARRVPPELTARCEAIHTKGGPAPLPAGLELPVGQPVQVQLLANATAEAAAAGGEGRASRRLRGDEVDRRVIFQDPEAIMRAQRQARKRSSDLSAPLGLPGSPASDGLILAEEGQILAEAAQTQAAAADDRPLVGPGDTRSDKPLEPSTTPTLQKRSGRQRGTGEDSTAKLPDTEEPAAEQDKALRSGSLGGGRQINAGVSLDMTEGEGPASSGQAGSGDSMGVRPSDDVLPAVGPSNGPDRELAKGHTRPTRALMGGFKAALVSFSSALQAREAIPPRAAKRGSTPGADLLNGENRVRLPVAPTAHTPEAGASARMLQAATHQNVPSTGDRHSDGGKLATPSASGRPESAGTPGPSSQPEPALKRPRVYVSTPHPRASRFAAADRMQKDSEAQCTPDETDGIGDSFATPANEAAVGEASGEASAADLQEPPETEEQTRQRASRLKEAFVKETDRMLLDALESVYSRISRVVHANRYTQDRDAVAALTLAALKESVEAIHA